MLDAMAALACERGFAGASVTLVCARAKTSRRAFYEEFESREACFLAVLDDGLRLASEVISEAFEHARGEEGDGTAAALNGLREALAALLALMDERPRLARVWMIEAQAAGAWALERRERNVMALTERIVARWGLPRGSKAIVPAAVMASVLGLIQQHMLAGGQEPLLSLLGPLMGVVGTPYLDGEAVEREVRLGRELAQRVAARSRCEGPAEEGRDPPIDPVPALLRNPKAPRPRECLLRVAADPGCSNHQITVALGIVNHTQTSKLLARLRGMGLIEKRSAGAGWPNEWRLTAFGEVVAQALRDRGPALDGEAWRADGRTSYTNDTAGNAVVTS
jgi:AcrR family transcriptional regulator